MSLSYNFLLPSAYSLLYDPLYTHLKILNVPNIYENCNTYSWRIKNTRF